MRGSHLGVIGHWARARLRWRLLSGKTLGRYQDWMARRIVEYARQHSPYYRDLFAGHDTSLWQALPTSDKAAMMAHFNDFNTRGVDGAEALEAALQAERSRDFSPTIGNLTVGLSSGTSGHRGLFLVSPWEQAGWAGAILA
nr:adenylate cyclase [Armatimonadota bacterium]